MTACIAPPPLEDADLLMIVDGAAPRSVLDHVARCAACAARAASLAQQQMALRARLNRAACPPSHELGDYRLGLLAAPAASRIIAHLAACPRCSAELAELDVFLAATAASLEPGALERAAAGLRQVTARLASGLDGLTPAPAYAVLRGEAGGPLMYEAEGWQVALEVVPDATDPARRSLLGLVMGLAAADGAEAALLQAGDVVVSSPVDVAGNFALDGLPQGRYDLRIGIPAEDAEILIAALSV
jgi:anti-sigma factor RsiW